MQESMNRTARSGGFGAWSPTRIMDRSQSTKNPSSVVILCFLRFISYLDEGCCWPDHALVGDELFVHQLVTTQALEVERTYY